MTVEGDCERLRARAAELNREAGLVGLGERGPFTLEELEDLRALSRLGEVIGRRPGGGGRVVQLDEGEDGDVLRMPRRFTEVYGLLWDKAYGPRGMQGLGNPNSIPGVGKAETRVSTGKTSTRAGAIPKKLKSRRNVVKNVEAFEFKRKMDARLAIIARDIKLFLDGSREEIRMDQCGRCGKMVSRGWKYCAYCSGILD